MENEHYESTCRYSEMSTADFVSEVFGIKLRWYQKWYLNLIDIKDSIEKRYMPFKYYFRYRK